MKRFFKKVLDTLSRFYDSLIPDEETARRIGEKCARIYGSPLTKAH